MTPYLGRTKDPSQIRVAGQMLWRSCDEDGSGSKLQMNAGEEAGMCHRLDSVYSTSGDSSQDLGMLQDCKQGEVDKALKVKTKRKVGRPIAYQGDPDSPDLDPEQRQIILRRIANRRSARRVRERRQNEVDKLTKRIQEIEATNAALRAKAKASDSKEASTRSELTELKEHARMLALKNELMQHDVAHLTSALVERQQARRIEPGHTRVVRRSPLGGSPPHAPHLPPAMSSAAAYQAPPSTFGYLAAPEPAFPAGNPPDLPATPLSPLPVAPTSPFPGTSPVPHMPEQYLRELLHVISWSNN